MERSLYSQGAKVCVIHKRVKKGEKISSTIDNMLHFLLCTRSCLLALLWFADF